MKKKKLLKLNNLTYGKYHERYTQQMRFSKYLFLQKGYRSLNCSFKDIILSFKYTFIGTGLMFISSLYYQQRKVWKIEKIGTSGKNNKIGVIPRTVNS